MPAFRLAKAEANLREALSWAGTVLHFTPSLKLIARKKGPTDFALLADLRIEAGIRRILSKGSTVPVVSEEGDAGVDVRSLPAFWSVDPIDGTVNYARSLPECGVSIALVVGGRAVLAGVTFPFLGEDYFAAAGCGAFLNGRRIRIAPTSRLIDAVVAFGEDSKNSAIYTVTGE